MKKIVYISGIVCANLMLIGALLKALHLPGANIFLMVSILLFCFGFLPISLVSSYKSSGEKKYKSLYIITFVVFSIVLLGALFKILHWPGAGLFLLIGTLLPFVLFLPAYLIYTRNEKSVVNLMGVIFGMTFFAVFSVLLSLNPSLNVLNNYTLSFVENEKTREFSQSISQKENNDKEIVQKADELCAYINELKCELLITSGNQCIRNDDGLKQESYVSINNYSSQTSLLFEGDSKRKVDFLKDRVDGFRKSVLSSKEASNELKELTKSIFDSSNYKVVRSDGQVIDWAEREFSTNNLIVLLASLSRIESNVRFIESECFPSK